MPIPFASIYDPIPTGEPFTSVYNAPPEKPVAPETTEPVVARPAKPVATPRVSAPAQTAPANLGELPPYIAPKIEQMTKATQTLPEIQRAYQYLAKSEADLKGAEQQVEIDLLREKGAAAQKSAEDIKKRIEETHRKQDEFPSPEFHPTKENAQSLGELFSMVSTVGIMLGGSGKLSSLNALNAMGGMLKGWQAGRADLYKREKETFEKEVQRIKSIHEQLRKNLEDYLKLAAVDKEAAMYKAEEIARMAGKDSIINAMMNKGQITGAIKLLEEAKSVFNEIEARKARADEAAAARAERANERRLDRENQFKIAKLRAQTSSRGGAAQETALRVMQQDIGNAVYNLDDLKERAEKTGKLPGGSVAFSQKFTGDIGTMILRYAANQTIDEGLQANDALMLNLAFDIASAQSGGRGQLSDAKVRAVVQQMPLDEQPEDTKAAKWAALMTRVKEANRSMPEDKRIDIPENMDKYFMGARYKSEGAKKKATRADVTATATANGITEEDAKSRLKAKGYEIEGE